MRSARDWATVFITANLPAIDSFEILIKAVQSDARCSDRRRPVLQDWVQALTYMQQSVLIAAVRGPDTIRKDHPVKVLCRWLRRCVMLSAFEGRAVLNPSEPGGGSFTGPSLSAEEALKALLGLEGEKPAVDWHPAMIEKFQDGFLRCTDQIPHHFTLHFLHAAEIIGYKHPEPGIRNFWRCCYAMGVNDMHLCPESESDMDKRLGDNERDWRAREEVTAK